MKINRERVDEIRKEIDSMADNLRSVKKNQRRIEEIFDDLDRDTESGPEYG